MLIIQYLVKKADIVIEGRLITETAMKKTVFFMFVMILCTSAIYAEYANSGGAYIVYQDAKTLYRNKKMAASKAKFLEVVKKYPDSKFVPNALYMLSFIETDYLKIIDYLNIIRNQYPDFRYWKQAVEKLGDIYYVIGSFDYAAKSYKEAKTEHSLYMLAVISAANAKFLDAARYSRELLKQTQDHKLAYKGLLILIDAYVSLRKYNSALNAIRESVKLKDWAYDNGTRVLYYAGKSYFYQKKYEQALYCFSMLRTQFPLSSEASLVKNYMKYLAKKNVVIAEPVDWVEKYFSRPAELAFKNEQIGIHDYELEDTLEKKSTETEDEIGNIAHSKIEGYVVRVGKYKDLGVANLVATDLGTADKAFPIGIYFKNGLYYAEIRGISDLKTAKSYAKRLIALGYSKTKVIEVVKVTEYDP